MSETRDRPEIELLAGKVIGGRRFDRFPLEESERLRETSASLRGTPDLVPRGIYRFSSFAEADAWMTRMIAATHARRAARTSSACATR